MAKNQKRPIDERGIYKDGTQKNEDDRNKLDAPSEKKKRINECI